MSRELPPEDPVGPVRQGKSAVTTTADDLAVLNPDITLPLAGGEVTVREYGFWKAQEIIYQDRAFLDDCIHQLSSTAVDPWEGVRSLAGRHSAYLRLAIAVACERPVTWVESLSPRETDQVFSTWWAVNGHFFLHEATVVLRGRLARMVSRSPGRPSSASSDSHSGSTPGASATTTPSDSLN